MQRTYTYLSSKYKVHVVFLGYFMVVLTIFFAVKLIINPQLNIYVLGLVAAGYGAANTFVFKSNPKDVIIDDDSISFISPSGNAKYDISRLTNFQVKDFANAQFYLRVAQDDGKRVAIGFPTIISMTEMIYRGSYILSRKKWILTI